MMSIEIEISDKNAIEKKSALKYCFFDRIERSFDKTNGPRTLVKTAGE